MRIRSQASEHVAGLLSLVDYMHGSIETRNVKSAIATATVDTFLDYMDYTRVFFLASMRFHYNYTSTFDLT